MKKVKRVLSKWFEHVINVFANALPDDPLSARFRPVLYRCLGNSISSDVRIFGGGRVCGGGLVVEPGVFINRGCYFDLSAVVHLGKGCTVGHGVTFITANHRLGPPEHRAGEVYASGITVGVGVWIGANAIILPGVQVGKGAVIGAAAVVTRDIPANCLVTGVPARIAKELLDT